MLFNTKIIDFIQNELQNDVSLFNESPFYQRDPLLRKSGLLYKYTQEEMAEFMKCSRDILYFTDGLVKVSSPTAGLTKLKLRDYQQEYLKVLSNRFIINLASRQTGTTLIHAIDAFHTAIFNNDKNIVFCVDKRDTGVEIIDKIKTIYCGLPFYLKPGIVTWNQNSISFENGCRITSTYGKSPAIGFTIDVLYMIDFAHITPSVIETYYRAIYPIMAAHKNSKIVISSTPNKKNKLFTKLWEDANLADNDPLKNSFVPFRIDYWCVPGRDEKWVEEEIKIIGKEAFEQEYELKFLEDNEDNPIKKLEEKIDDLTKQKIVNEDGSVAEFRVPTMAELLERIEKLEKNIEELEKLNNNGNPNKIIDNPGQVTWKDVEAFKQNNLNIDELMKNSTLNELMGLSGTASTPLS